MSSFLISVVPDIKSVREKLFLLNKKPIVMSIDEFNTNQPYVNNIWCCQNVWTYSDCVISNYLCCQYWKEVNSCSERLLSASTMFCQSWAAVYDEFYCHPLSQQKCSYTLMKWQLNRAYPHPWEDWLLKEKLETLWNWTLGTGLYGYGYGVWLNLCLEWVARVWRIWWRNTRH